MDAITAGTPVLAVEFFADYGQFKKYFTTMSPLSFPLPTGTALRGMLGAICGVDRDRAPQRFAGARLAIGLAGPVRKVVVPVNFIITKESPAKFARFEQHRPTTVEYVKDARYRVYIAWDDADGYRDLKTRLQRHESVYTLCFGNSESLANYQFLGETRVVEVAGGEAELASIVPTARVTRLDYRDSELFTLRLPVAMSDDRVVSDYCEFLFDRRGAAVKGVFTRFERLETGERLAFF